MTPKDEQRIRELRTQTRPMSYMDISYELAISESEVRKFCQKEGLNKRPKSTKKPFYHGVYTKQRK